MKKLLITTAMLAALIAPAHADNPEQTCQGQVLSSITKKWSGVLRRQFEIILDGNRCLVFLQATSMFEGKRTAMLIEGKNGELLAEFYAPSNGRSMER